MKITYYVMPRQTGKTEHLIYEFIRDPWNSFFITINRDMTKYVYQRSMNNTFQPEDSRMIRDRIRTADRNFDELHGYQDIKKIFVDEYAFMDRLLRIKLIDSVRRLEISQSSDLELVIATSVNEQYDIDLFNIVKKFKREYYAHFTKLYFVKKPTMSALMSFIKVNSNLQVDISSSLTTSGYNLSNMFKSLELVLGRNAVLDRMVGNFVDAHRDQLSNLLSEVITDPDCTIIDPTGLYKAHHSYHQHAEKVKPILNPDQYDRGILNKLFTNNK